MKFAQESEVKEVEESQRIEFTRFELLWDQYMLDYEKMAL